VANGRIARLDPSRTITLRRQWQADVARRFDSLRRELIELVLHEDALGLRQRKPFTFNVDEPGKWITVKGQHVFIPEGKDTGDAIKEHFEGLKGEKIEWKEGWNGNLHMVASFPVHREFRSDSDVVKSQGLIQIHLERTTPDDFDLDIKDPEEQLASRLFDVDCPATELSFEDASQEVRDAGKYGLTGFGHQHEIINKVVSASVDGIKQFRPPFVYFSAKEPSRVKLYNYLVRRVEERLPGYTAIQVELPNTKYSSAYFALIKKTKLQSVRTLLDASKTRYHILHKSVQETFNVEGRWKFHTDEQKVQSFLQWLKAKMLTHLVGEHLDEQSWWHKYIVEGWKKGAGRAFDDSRPQVREWQDTPEAKQRLDFYNGTREEFLRSSFNHPASREKVKLLASRTFTDLKGVTDQMAARISHTLVDGLTKGDNPRVIARELAKQVDVSKSRAQTIARTEIIRVHAEGQLDAFERMGVTELGVMAEWSTAEDARVCKLCRPLDGVVLKVEEAHGLLPRHVNCRCAFVPANLGEDESKQKRTSGSIQRAIDASYKAEAGKRTLAEQKAKSRWGAADKTIAKARPKGVFNSKERKR